MSIRAIHQFVSSFVPRDAVGGHTVAVRALLHDLGIASEIYVKETRGALGRTSRPFRSYEGDGPGTYLLYQAATGSVVADFLLGRPEPKIVNYHNITPPKFFEPWEPHVGVELEVGLRQVEEMARASAVAVCDSSFNASDLQRMGYRSPVVVPILLDLADFEREVDAAALDRLETGKRGGGADWLFVGRIAPNKAHHDVVKAFALYRRLYDPRARLHFVGVSGSPRYFRMLRAYVNAVGLLEAVEFAGSVPGGELAAYYRTADVFVCLSEHEGFCIPLLEAMHHRVPVVAYAATAVPETLDGAGLLLARKDPATVAAAVERVVRDAALRHALAAAAEARLEDFRLERTRARFADVIRALDRETS